LKARIKTLTSTAGTPQVAENSGNDYTYGHEN